MADYEAVGLVEVKYFTIASQLLDAMCKGSNVDFLSSENYLGGRLVTLVIGGSISEVQGALEIAKHVNPEITADYLKGAVLISNPAPEIMNYLAAGKEDSQQISEEENENE